MMLSKFFLPFLVIAFASLVKATSFDPLVEEVPVTCEGTPASIMGLAERSFFASTFVRVHNFENTISSDDGVDLRSANVTSQELQPIETIRANLRTGWDSNTYSNLMKLILKGGCNRCRLSLAETSPTIREDFSTDLTNALRASNFSYFHSNTFTCTVGPIETNVLAAE